MELFKQFGIIFGVCLLGEGVSYILPFTFPSSVTSMILMLLFLCFKLIKEDQINMVGNFLLKNLGFFFIPASTAIIREYDKIKDSIIPLILVSIIGALVTFIATYYTVCFVSRITKKENE